MKLHRWRHLEKGAVDKRVSCRNTAAEMAMGVAKSVVREAGASERAKREERGPSRVKLSSGRSEVAPDRRWRLDFGEWLRRPCQTRPNWRLGGPIEPSLAVGIALPHLQHR